MTITPKLKIIIVGSGLAGLGTARVVREHHDVTVVERGNSDLASGGQGIVFFTSTVKILKGIGYDTTRVRPCQITYFRHYDREGSNETSEYLDFERKYGAHPWSQLRSDCRDELVRLATALAEEVGLPNAEGTVKMIFNTPVVDVDPENAIITWNDGTTMRADLVIIADGIHSRLRNRVLGDDSYLAKKMGITIFRVAVPVAAARKVLETLPHWMQPDSEGKGCITYFQSLNNTNRLIGHGSTTQSWHADANHKEIIDAFEGFDETLIKLVKVGTQVKVWDMQDLDPIPFWNKGRTILIGDAAHAMTPMQGQGANMALEDAEAFSLFTRDTKSKDVPAVLEQIDSIRRPRTTRVLWTTRETLPNTNMEDRMSRMHYNNSYNGIRDALQQKDKELANGKHTLSVS